MTSKSPPSPRVLIVYPYNNISTNPTMQLLVDALGDAGFGVDLLANQTNMSKFPNFGTTNTRFKLVTCDDRIWWDFRRESVHRRVLRKARSPEAIDPGWFARFQVSAYHCVVGVDPGGIVAAARLNVRAQRPLVYVSFELLLSDEVVTADEQELKIAEREAAQHCSAILIQDGERGELFAADNGIDSSRLYFVPVAPKGRLPKQNNYWREKFGIPSQSMIVLFQGSVSSWNGRDEWEELVSYWPPEFVLVIHARNKLGARSQKFLRQLSKCPRILFSDEPVLETDLPSLTASADIGLISYTPSPDSWFTFGNLQHIGLASGKFSYFMMCGVPVLVNSRTSLAALVERQRVGKSYANLQDSTLGLQAILGDYLTMSRTARSFYDTQLNPENRIKELVKALL